MKDDDAIRPTATAPTDGTPDWEIEDLTEIQQVGGPTWSNRWLGVVIAIAVAIVGFGFVSRWSTEPRTPRTEETRAEGDQAPAGSPATAIAPAFALTAPGSGSLVMDSVVQVRGVAGRPLGVVHVAVLLGDAVLGWTNVSVSTAGPVVVNLSTFAPPLDVPVMVRIGGGGTASGPGFETSMGLRMRVSDAVNVWRTDLRGGPTPTTLQVDGYGPLTSGQLELRLLAADGAVLASGATTAAVEDGRPGSVGGRLIGLGSFTARLTIPDPLPPGELTLAISWRDGPSGPAGEIRRVVRELTKPGVLP